MRAVRFSLNCMISPIEEAKSGVSSIALSALEPACTPIDPPERSSRVLKGEDALTTTTCAFFTYGSEKRRFSFLSSVMVKPFHRQSMFPVMSSCSLLFQSIGWGTSSTPRRLHTSLAQSMSNPTISPFSSRYPIGGNESSRPRTNCPFSRTSLRELSTPFSEAPPAKSEKLSKRATRIQNVFFICTTTRIRIAKYISNANV